MYDCGLPLTLVNGSSTYLLDQIPWNTEYRSEFVISYTGGKNVIPPNTST